jgi:hypothetical protein
MSVSEEGVNADWGMQQQSDPSVHNCNISCPVGFGSHSDWLESFAHTDSRCLVFDIH